jgi:hypothetical protein
MHEVGDRKIALREHSHDVFEMHLYRGNLFYISWVFRRHLNDPTGLSQVEMVSCGGLTKPHSLVRLAALDDAGILSASSSNTCRQRDCRHRSADFHAGIVVFVVRDGLDARQEAEDMTTDWRHQPGLELDSLCAPPDAKSLDSRSRAIQHSA